MMSSAHAVSSNGSSRRSIGLAALLMVSSLAGIMFVPTAAASVSGDYEITASISPMPGDFITAWDPITLEVEVTNTGFFYNTQTRSIEWFVCEGIQDETSCYNDRDDYGTGSIEPLAVGNSISYTFTQMYSSDGEEGAFTIVYRFLDSDTNTSNDIGIYNFNFAQNLVDIEIEPQDPITKLENLATYNGDLILNTDTDYNISIEGVVSSCASCGLVADIGWKIIDTFGVERANATTAYSDLPSLGEAIFTRQMPPLNFDTEGQYTLVFGLLNSSGTPSGDMNSYNNQQSVDITFDDSVDLQITSMYPLNAPSSPKYFYGNDSVSVTVTNLGNHTVVEPLVRFTVMNLDEEVQSEEDCNPAIIIPSQSFNCIFDMNQLGDKKLKVFVSEALNEGLDVKPSDNILNVVSEVIAGDIGPSIQQSDFYGTYKTADNIDFTASILPTAAGPLTYTWWQAGIIPLGSGQSLQVPAMGLGLGDHFISVRATDSLGTVESATTLITVFNSSDIGVGDWLNGSAVTRTHAASNGAYDYPAPGVNYLTGNGADALIRMSIDVFSTSGDADPGMDWMEFDVNISKLIPDNIPRESIAIHQLLGYEQGNWQELDSENTFEIIDNDTIRIHINQNMDLLIVGELPPPEIESGQPELTKLPDGKMRLDWNPTGDLDNPYFGGWNIYRITSPITASAYFPDPNEVSSQFVWNGLMQGSLSASLEGTAESWIDERELATGMCASYAIIPVDKSAVANHMEASVTMVDGTPGLTCGDAIDPNSEVSGLSASLAYNNDTACYNLFMDWNRCYEVTLTWTWPDHEPEGNITWNLYRVENKPNDADLRFIEPIMTGLINEPGEKGTITQYGTEFDGIMPLRTYYYILTPLDTVGNELTIIDYPSSNIERVYVDEKYWEYNQDRIPVPPEPPEPPYGVEWLGDLEEYMQIEIFQIAGVVMLLTIVINFIGLPLILKKKKKMSRVLARRAGKSTGDDDDFEDFFN